jgi:hypothetical protein
VDLESKIEELEKKKEKSSNEISSKYNSRIDVSKTEQTKIMDEKSTQR